MIEWTKEEIKILEKFGSIKLSHELQEMLPHRSIYSIQHKCKRLRILKEKSLLSEHARLRYYESQYKILSEKCYRKLDQSLTIENLDNVTYQILIGSILGDGGVTNQNRNKTYIFKETHCLAQRDYLAWKHDMLHVFCPNKVSGTRAVCFSTPSHSIFKKIRDDFYNEEEKRKAFIKLNYIERLDEFGLLIWYLDDGDTPKYPVITSCLFDDNDLEESVKIINKNLGLSLKIIKRSKKRNNKTVKRIFFGATNRNILMPKWCEISKKFDIPKCMWYKIKGLE